MPYRFEIEQDIDLFDPRTTQDNLTTLVCFHRRYSLPLEAEIDHRDYSSWSEMEAAIVKKFKPVVIKPLYMYDHSVQDIATSYQPYWWHADWDAGQIGFVFVTKESLKKMGTPLNRAEAVLESEVAEFAAYVRGEGYIWRVLDEDGEEYDSCGGYSRYQDAEAEAQALVDRLNLEETEEAWQKTVEVQNV